MNLHDRLLIIISSLTLIAGGATLVSHAQGDAEEKSNFIPNTITYIAKQDDRQNITPPLFNLGTGSHQTMIPDHLRNILTNSDEHDHQEEKEYDFISDESLQRYVSRQQHFNNKQYKPHDLVKLQNDHLILTQKNMQLRQEAASKIYDLAGEFHEIFGKKLVLVSAYRSYHYQKHLKDKGCADTLCAPPGHSEHQGGLAIDIFAATTAGDFLSKADFKKYYLRLSDNAHRYGRHNTYQKGIQIDSYQPEPRHWRYVGRDLATELYEKKMTLAEWVKKEKR